MKQHEPTTPRGKFFEEQNDMTCRPLGLSHVSTSRTSDPKPPQDAMWKTHQPLKNYHMKNNNNNNEKIFNSGMDDIRIKGQLI